MREPGQLITHFQLNLGGRNAPEELMRSLLEIMVESSLHMPDVATLVIHDPRLHWIDNELIKPGQELQVWVTDPATGQESREPIFDGEIVELEPEFTPATHSLTVRAFDRLHRLTRGQRVRSFQDVTDGDVVRLIAEEVRLEPDTAETRQVHSYLLQCNQTNLEFLRERAAAHGYLLYAYGKKLCFKPLTHDESIELQWGKSLLEFRPRLTTLSQVGMVQARGWDPITRQELLAQISDGQGMRDIGQKQSGGELVKQAFRLETNHLIVDRPVRTQSGAENLAQAMADRVAESFVEAEGVCAGNPGLVAGVSILVSAVGQQFSGKYFVTSASHVHNAHDGYVTRFTISGQSPASLLRLLRSDKERNHSEFFLVLGVVTDNRDPQGWGRVRVKYPGLSSDHTSDWARVVAIGAGPGRGIEFLPEVNDEVLIGFEMGDVHHPYVLGGLWNGQDAPPKKSDQIVSNGRVRQRIIRSRSGHMITLDDDDGGILLADRDGNRVQLNRKGIAIAHQNGNSLTLQSGKLDINVKGRISIEATDEVSINGSFVKLNCKV